MELLFPKLNKKKTLENVSDFFKHDLERLILMSGRSLTDLSSPRLSHAPSSTNFGNHVENQLINGIDAEAMIEAVHDTIYHCPYTSSVILTELFVKRQSWNQVKPMVYSENYKFSYLRRKAMFDFAESFNFWQRQHHCQPIISLQDFD